VQVLEQLVKRFKFCSEAHKMYRNVTFPELKFLKFSGKGHSPIPVYVGYSLITKSH